MHISSSSGSQVAHLGCILTQTQLCFSFFFLFPFHNLRLDSVHFYSSSTKWIEMVVFFPPSPPATRRLRSQTDAAMQKRREAAFNCAIHHNVGHDGGIVKPGMTQLKQKRNRTGEIDQESLLLSNHLSAEDYQRHQARQATQCGRLQLAGNYPDHRPVTINYKPRRTFFIINAAANYFRKQHGFSGTVVTRDE